MLKVTPVAAWGRHATCEDLAAICSHLAVRRRHRSTRSCLRHVAWVRRCCRIEGSKTPRGSALWPTPPATHSVPARVSGREWPRACMSGKACHTPARSKRSNGRASEPSVERRRRTCQGEGDSEREGEGG